MFHALHDSLFSAVRFLRGRGRLTEANMREGLEMVRQSLLEADVALPVVQSFMESVSERALGESVMKLLDPTEQLVSIVKDALTDLLGSDDPGLELKKPLSIIMLCGLQGSGKTTTCGKLALWLKKQKRRPMLVAADLQRPAAIDQLETLGKTLEVPVHTDRASKDPVAVCRAAIQQAQRIDANVDVVILDTAGRLHIDDDLMRQLSQIESQVKPDHVLFVVDAMTGQDAVRSAEAFHKALDLDGVIMTKLDGDARGGAALSVRKVTGVPIRFVGTGEVMDALEEFHPDRMVSRILGMGDMLTFIEQAQEKLDKDELAKNQSRLLKGEFTLDDFRAQMTQTRRLGSFSKVLSFIPGFGQIGRVLEEQANSGTDIDKEMQRVGGIIDAMTPEERRNPKVIDNSRRQRIARGAGCAPHDISRLIKSFTPMAEMVRSMAGGDGATMPKVQDLLMRSRQAMENPAAANAMMPAKKGTGKRLTPKERAEAKKKREKEMRRKKQS